MDNTNTINVIKLTRELREAGITSHGNCNSMGIVWDDDNNEIQDRKDVQAVISKHDPTPNPEPEPIEERVKKLETALLETKAELTTVKTQVDELKALDMMTK